MPPKLKIYLAMMLIAFLILNLSGLIYLDIIWKKYSHQDVKIEKDILFQVSTFNTFAAGKYAGVMSYQDLHKHGDFGTGTFDSLDGEMIALNGIFYQIPSSGIPRIVNLTQTTPYAVVTFFEPERVFKINNFNYTQLKTFLDKKFFFKNSIYAIKVNGTFDWAQTRSPEKQIPPYSNLNESLKTQHVFNLNNVKATAVGFWFSDHMKDVNLVGYHLHLITNDHTAGGHLLDFLIKNAKIEIERVRRYKLVLH